MDINQTIFNSILDFSNCYDIDVELIEDLLLTNKDEKEDPEVFIKNRQSKAIELIKKIMSHNGKSNLYELVVQLAEVETKIKQLQPWVRDHVHHSVLTFLLGTYINENFMNKFQRQLNEKLNLSAKISPFQWKLASLFHDIGYPLEIASNIISKEYSATINSIRNQLSVKGNDVSCNISFNNIDKLVNGANSFDLIQLQIDKWDLEIDAKKEFEKKASLGKVCHGMMSSLSLMYIIDLMYESYSNNNSIEDWEKLEISWEREIFYNEIIPACAAIFVHNLPMDCFKSKKISPSKAPLAYLLRLCDTLQEWERAGEKNLCGEPREHFDIEVCDDKLLFYVKNLIEKKNTIIRVIKGTLEYSECIEIVRA